MFDRKNLLVFIYLICSFSLFSFDRDSYQYEPEYTTQQIICITENPKIYDSNKNIIDSRSYLDRFSIVSVTDWEKQGDKFFRYYEIELQTSKVLLRSDSVAIIQKEFNGKTFAFQEMYNEIGYSSFQSQDLLIIENTSIKRVDSIRSVEDTDNLFEVYQFSAIDFEDFDGDNKTDINLLSKLTYIFNDKTFFNFAFENVWIRFDDLEKIMFHDRKISCYTEGAYESYFYIYFRDNNSKIVKINEYILNQDDFDDSIYSVSFSQFILDNQIYSADGIRFRNSCRINSDYVNFRSSAEISNNKIKQLHSGDIVKPRDIILQEKTIAGDLGVWLKVEDQDKNIGWIFDPFIDWYE